MSRLIAISNRVAVPKAGKSAGGLAVGVLAALAEHGGVWFGWSGKTTDSEPGDTKRTQSDNIEFVTIDLNADDFEAYYNGFSNNSLWPLLHFMLGYFSFRRSQYAAYCRVNEFFSRRLIPVIEPDDLIWVHDYHLFPLGANLRQAGVTQPIGFFLHVPFPNFDVLRALPCYTQMLSALAAYDVVGFQTDRDLWSFQDCMTQPEIGGHLHDDGRITAFGRTFKAEVFPIGIDVEECQRVAVENLDNKELMRLGASLEYKKLIIGVDRLDYSKGLELRFRGFETLLESYPSTRGTVTFMQIAPPTRAGVRTYDTIREGLEKAAGNINGRYAEVDWVPIRYLNRGYSRELLMAIFRRAAVGLVTPIRDGMNLVAKEYVASQDPEDPGVPVLSTLCGAARELTDAVLVNPFDRQGVADGLQKAIEMPLNERRAIHASMLAVLRKNDIHAWTRRFIDSLSTP
ncbi:MAG: trehalose-6-phosphate synthase [Gammaproteobacteria bacterium]|nr:trehalose-6-phosphate synthase [Gammaproteobacteria bacterium]